jgi:hypothetical protein
MIGEAGDGRMSVGAGPGGPATGRAVIFRDRQEAGRLLGERLARPADTSHIDLHGDYDHAPERDPGNERRISVGLEGRAGDPADPNDLATQRSPEACA